MNEINHSLTADCNEEKWKGEKYVTALSTPDKVGFSEIIFMPPTSEKLRGHIGLGLSVRPSVRPSVRLSVRNTWQLRNSRTAYARILKFYMWHVHEK